MALEDKVKDIIVEQLGVNAEQVNPEASFIEDVLETYNWIKSHQSARWFFILNAMSDNNQRMVVIKKTKSSIII